MAYRKFYRQSKPQPRGITVKYAGNCICCGASIKVGESAMYYPAGTIAGIREGKIGHIGGLDGNSAVCTANIREQRFPEYAAELRERAVVNDYAGDGLDARYEDDCARQCGLID